MFVGVGRTVVVGGDVVVLVVVGGGAVVVVVVVVVVGGGAVVVVVAGGAGWSADCMKITVTNRVPLGALSAPTPTRSNVPRMFALWLGEFMKAVWRRPTSGPIPTFSPSKDHPLVTADSCAVVEWKIVLAVIISAVCALASSTRSA